jgi:hypothetical protein
MRDNATAAAPSAYAYPLLIKQLLHTPFVQACSNVPMPAPWSRID